MAHLVTIYRSERAVFALPVRPDEAGPFSRSPIFVARPPDVPIVRFDVYEFAPRPLLSEDGASFRRLRMASVPIVVASSLPAVLVGEGRRARLSVWWSPKGIDAGAVYEVARRGEKGMRIVDAQPDRVREAGEGHERSPAALLQGADAGRTPGIEAVGAGS